MAISGGVPQSNNVQLQSIMDLNTLLLITILILVAFWFVGVVRKISSCLIRCLLLAAAGLWLTYAIYMEQIPG